MTGTLRDYRGRGLAQLAKRATLVNAAKRGVELVSTDNDETNAPMLRTQREARLSANRQQAHVVAALNEAACLRQLTCIVAR